MRPFPGGEVREAFLSFFEEKGHKRLPSASLVPENDPTLLFTGAGMNQFKDMFLGKGNLPWKRVCTVQKCMRVPDLEKVGRTPRHHTLFEMLGNFSFGDYFKRECVAWEWEFFHRRLGIPEEQMVVTIYEKDEEAFRAWTEEVGLPPEKIFRFGEKENFWPAEAPSKGPDGPCGPCSEIYFDARPGEPLPPKEGLTALPEDRFTEIGNCVFTQFDRKPGGVLAPLPQKNIDVGLGLERIVAVLAGAPTNFDTDLFLPYIRDLAARTGKEYGSSPEVDERMRRISDHLRAVVFALADGIVPGNEGRGYVIRKILRRAERDGIHLGLKEPFLWEMAPLVGEIMGEVYPEVAEAQERIRPILETEEKAFRQVYERGLGILEEMLGRLPKGGTLSGEDAFVLHDTYGFPFDTCEEECRERGFQVDREGFLARMEEQRARSRKGSALSGAVFDSSPEKELARKAGKETEFTGYERDRDGGKVLALSLEGKLVEEAPAGKEILFAVDRTPFYAESGGQVGDRGTFQGEGGLQGRVVDTFSVAGVHVHKAVVEKGTIRVGREILLEIDARARRATERNHTATHLLHAALRKVLGEEVHQAGSLVGPEKLRFDFTWGKRLTPEQIRAVEDLVNARILRALDVIARVMPLEEARRQGFMALFGEKYGDHVRTISIGEFSRELCGGTHARNTGALGRLIILSESSVSAGTRRIEAVTGEGAIEWSRSREALLERLAGLLKCPVAGLEERVKQVQEEVSRLKRELEKARSSQAMDHLPDLEGTGREVGGVQVFLWKKEGLGMEELAGLADKLKERHKDLAALLASPGPGGKVFLLAVAAGKALEKGVHAGRLLSRAARTLGGGGGGKPGFAQGQGKEAARVEEALEEAGRELVERLGG